MPQEFIHVKGAREHNLKNIEITIPRDKLVVITGVSGSGKSSLAFDTIYAEGQRRYVESLSAYARQFLDQMQKPELDFIEGLSPTIAIEQRSAGGSMRSIIATTTEIYDYLRLLYAHIGRPHCPDRPHRTARGRGQPGRLPGQRRVELRDRRRLHRGRWLDGRHDQGSGTDLTDQIDHFLNQYGSASGMVVMAIGRRNSTLLMMPSGALISRSSCSMLSVPS